MEHRDPYRATEPGESRGPVVLAGPNRVRTGWHAVLLVGLLGATGWAFVHMDITGIRVVIGLVGLGVLADMGRTIHEAVLPHRVLADARGLELSWATRAGWWPWMRRRSVAIAWHELAGVRTHTVTINHASTTDLHLEWLGGLTIEIPDGTFHPDAAQLQTRILDEWHARRAAPAREEARVADFCRARFETPLRLCMRVKRVDLGLLVLAVMMLGLGGFLAAQVGAWLAALPLGLGLFLAWLAVAPPKWQILELDAHGIAAGRTPSQLQRTDWDAVTYARPQVVNGVVTEVAIATPRARIILRGDWTVPLHGIAQLVDPSTDAVIRARAAMAAGDAPEEAARKAGLWPRPAP